MHWLCVLVTSRPGVIGNFLPQPYRMLGRVSRMRDGLPRGVLSSRLMFHVKRSSAAGLVPSVVRTKLFIYERQVRWTRSLMPLLPFWTASSET